MVYIYTKFLIYFSYVFVKTLSDFLIKFLCKFILFFWIYHVVHN